MGKTLQSILEMQFNFLWYLHMNISDFDNCDLKDLEWMYNKLIQKITKKHESNNPS
jgi:hypothetical protein